MLTRLARIIDSSAGNTQIALGQAHRLHHMNHMTTVDWLELRYELAFDNLLSVDCGWLADRRLDP